MPRGFADHSVQRRVAADRSVWAGAAFVVEALILLAFLAGCLAVFMQLFGDATERGRQNVQLEAAVELASNRAEQFAASPLAGMESSAGDGRLEQAAGAAGGAGGAADAAAADGDLVVTCDVTPEDLPAGVLYHAVIGVWDGDELVYELATARYVSGAAAGDGDAAGAGGAGGPEGAGSAGNAGGAMGGGSNG